MLIAVHVESILDVTNGILPSVLPLAFADISADLSEALLSVLLPESDAAWIVTIVAELPASVITPLLLIPT